MKKTALYLSSRNNYSLLENFLINNKRFIKDYYLVNVDDSSERCKISLASNSQPSNSSGTILIKSQDCNLLFSSNM